MTNSADLYINKFIKVSGGRDRSSNGYSLITDEHLKMEIAESFAIPKMVVTKSFNTLVIPKDAPTINAI